MSHSLLALAAALLLPAQGGPPGQPASQPASQPGAITKDLTGVSAQVTVIHELGDQALRTQESWTIAHNGSAAIDPSVLTVQYPAIRLLKLDDDVQGFEAAEDRQTVKATRPLSPGMGSFAGAYILDTQRGTASYKRRFPVEVEVLRVILEEAPNLSVTSNIEATRRNRDLNGIKFAIWDFARIPANQEVSIEIKGIPYKPVWPTQLTMLIGALIVLWAFWAVRSGKVPGGELSSSKSPLSAGARKDRILRAIELLDEDLDREKVSENRYKRRHEDLTRQLAVVLRELDLEGQAQPAARKE